MGRPQRFEEAGGVYHITSRGVRRTAIFRDHHDYELFIRFLAFVAREYRWRLFAYCLMPNHFHLHLETTEPNLSDGMHRLKLKYAQVFNRRYDCVGHVFEGRFRCTPVEDEHHFFEVARYVVLNPVRAELCEHPGLWRWSSFAATVGREPNRILNLDRFLAEFGRDPTVYMAFVAEAMAS
jgi:REP element-mobilizing transposase RayT